jgi:hypothetical protein
LRNGSACTYFWAVNAAVWKGFKGVQNLPAFCKADTDARYLWNIAMRGILEDFQKHFFIEVHKTYLHGVLLPSNLKGSKLYLGFFQLS